MPYYIFRDSLSTEKIGKHYPQSQEMSNGYLYNDPHSIWQIRNERLPFTPNLDAFVLNGQSKKTDVISAVAINNNNNILIRTDLVKILHNLNICEHQVFPATVIYRKKKFNYSLLHFYNYHNQFIDFNKSTFFLGDKFRAKKHTLEIKDLNEFRQLNLDLKKNNTFRNRETINFEKIVLKDGKIEFDFFRLNVATNYFVISENLKNAIDTHDISGVDIIPVNDFEIKIRVSSM